jgi:hypothetical protein
MFPHAVVPVYPEVEEAELETVKGLFMFVVVPTATLPVL